MTALSGNFFGVGTRVLNHAALIPTDDGQLRVGTAGGFVTTPLPFDVYNQEVLIQMDTFGGTVTGSVWKEDDPDSLVQLSHFYTPQGTAPALGAGDPTGTATFHEAWVSTRPLPIAVGSNPVRVAPAAVTYAWDADADGMGDRTVDHHATSSGRQGIGELDGLALSRLKLTFPLPESVADLQSARLRVYLDNAVGTPHGPLSLFHNASDNDLARLASDFEDPAYVDTGLDLVQPADPGEQFYELDVTDLVLADYAADGDYPVTAFRLQIDEALSVPDGQGNSCNLVATGAGGEGPRLILTFVPEPSSWVICVVAVGLILKAGGLHSVVRPEKVAFYRSSSRSQ
jgi:hypothetical protein